MEKLVLNKNEVKDFTLDINNGCFYWKCILIDNTMYQIYFKIVSNITQKGNKNKNDRLFDEF